MRRGAGSIPVDLCGKIDMLTTNVGMTKARLHGKEDVKQSKFPFAVAEKNTYCGKANKDGGKCRRGYGMCRPR